MDLSGKQDTVQLYYLVDYFTFYALFKAVGISIYLRCNYLIPWHKEFIRNVCTHKNELPAYWPRLHSQNQKENLGYENRLNFDPVFLTQLVKQFL